MNKAHDILQPEINRLYKALGMTGQIIKFICKKSLRLSCLTVAAFLYLFAFFIGMANIGN